MQLIGKRVTVKIDRPMGSYHPKHKDIFYPINYGYIEGIMAPDGEEQDAYVHFQKQYFKTEIRIRTVDK